MTLLIFTIYFCVFSVMSITRGRKAVIQSTPVVKATTAKSRAERREFVFDTKEGFEVLLKQQLKQGPQESPKPPVTQPNAPKVPAQTQVSSNKQDNPKQRDIKQNPSGTDKSKRFLDELPLEAGFQPDTDEEFPHIEGGKPRIPHIIHQIWMTGNASTSAEPVLPEKFVDNVKTFLNNNPNWTYYFWTDTSARKLIENRHKPMLFMYDNAPKLVVKTDILRYVLMYEFGGLYTDLDTINVRPLDIATTKYPCILMPIPFEQAAIWTFMPYRLCNGEMLCRPKHPFFKKCIDALPNRANFSFFPKIAGPLFIDEMFKIYNNISKDDLYKIDLNQETTTPYFYKGNRSATNEDGVYLPNTKYFLDSPSPALKNAAKTVCNKTDQTPLTQRACLTLNRLGYQRSSSYSFITHHFAASWMGAAAKNLKLVPLKSLTTKYKIYGQNA